MPYVRRNAMIDMTKDRTEDQDYLDYMNEMEREYQSYEDFIEDEVPNYDLERIRQTQGT